MEKQEGVSKVELKGIKMACLGDSITEDVGVSNMENMYYNRIQRECGVRQLYIDGIGGTRIVRQQTPSENPSCDQYFIPRVDAVDEDCDLIVVFGGTDDFGHGDASMGNAGGSDRGYLLGRLPCAYGSNKPEPVGTLYDYAEVIKTVTRRFSIPFLDMLQVSGMTPIVPVYKTLYMPDGLHPNDAGHEKIAQRLKEFLVSL